jgi:hypothetical protein
MTFDRPLEVLCARDPASGFALRLVFCETREGRRFAGELVMREVPDCGARGSFPDITIEDAAAQRLADMLWDAGFRAKGAQGSAGQLEAMAAHLKDMRNLAFDLLKRFTGAGGNE